MTKAIHKRNILRKSKAISGNQIYLRNCGHGVITNESLSVIIDDIKVGHSTLEIGEKGMGTVNISGLWQFSFDRHNLKVTNGAVTATALIELQLAEGLIVGWSFNEGADSVANDESGNGNDGIISGAGWTTGKYGNAIDISGTYQYAEKDWADFDTSDYTIVFWFKADIISSGWRDMVTIDSETGRIHLDSSDNSIIWYNVDGTGSLDSNVIPITGQWYHVVGTHKGNVVNIYVNGEVKNTKTAGTTNSKRLKVGTESEVFDGAIDEVRIYNRALTPDQTVVMKRI